ncbi:hypothetical protein [Shimia aestuarii]|uniref:Uncharacterized protein n=1 Tax=Shimia aestuarii TaxID=254406 RepID=A0A1I4IFQ2_9RHOB|nr:hypothetical protein [Shimia aestuarii]SFL53202.1 hypothetical protein SAMN04488042_101588 [Shimia aestuarii]
MVEFRFRPAPVRSERVFRLDADRLTCLKDDRAEWSLQLANITDAAFASYKAHGRKIWRLDLMSGDETHHINANLPSRDAYLTDDFAAFHGLVSALGEALPDQQILFGEHGRARKAIFAVGLLSALAGAGLFTAALLSGVSSSRLTEAAVPLLGLTLFGGLLIRAYNPWKRPPRIALTLLPPILTYMAGGKVEETP